MVDLIEHKKKYSEEIKKACAAGEDSFHDWFNKSGDTFQATVRGFWDFNVHILTPAVCRHIDHPENKIALEIGYGGARILNAACSYFREAIGIDIHDEESMADVFLRKNGKNNFKLLRTEGDSIKVPSESIDFVYSFIVFQHLPTFSVFVNYFYEIRRCLKKGGIAQIYFGSYSKLNPLERILCFTRGYCELPDAPVNHTSLVVRYNTVKNLCRKLDLRIIDRGISYKDVPDGYKKNRGGQNYITLIKE